MHKRINTLGVQYIYGLTEANMNNECMFHLPFSMCPSVSHTARQQTPGNTPPFPPLLLLPRSPHYAPKGEQSSFSRTQQMSTADYCLI